MELKYYRCRDYLLPDLGLTEEEQKPIGKYGQMRLDYLKKYRESLFNQLLLSGKLMAHLHEIDDTCHARLDLLIPQMKEAEGVTEGSCCCSCRGTSVIIAAQRRAFCRSGAILIKRYT